MNPPADSNLFLFHMLHRAHRNALLSALSARGLADVGQPMILFILEQSSKEGEIAAQKELAEQLHVSAATIAMSLKSLERRGYVRKLTDERDARCKRVVITQKGKEVVQSCYDVFRSVDEQMYQGFSEEEKNRFFSDEKRMLENLRRIGGDKDPEKPPFFVKKGCDIGC